MMVECPICTYGVDPDMPGCVQWMERPVHTGCHDVIAQSLTAFEPVLVDRHHEYDPNHKPVVYSWVGVTFQQYDCNWINMKDSVKERLYEEYCGVLERLLDHHQEVVEAYCRRNGLDRPRFVREIKQEKHSIVELKRLIRSQEMKPGDHVVLATLPRSMHHKHMSAQLVINIARFLARRGVTFHSAYVGIDWSKPLSQHIVRMALNIQLWQNTIYKPDIDIQGGRIFRLFGKKWHELQSDHAFQWVIRHIRDKKMSPRELFIASSRFWSVYAKVGYSKLKCVFISRKKRTASARRVQTHYYCGRHDIVSTIKTCPACGRGSNLVPTLMRRGVVFSKKSKPETGVDEYTRAWAFYLQYNPDQDATPWKTRSRFVPEYLTLADPVLADPVIKKKKEGK